MSATPVIHFLRQKGVSFTVHRYRYEGRGGTVVTSCELGVDEHIVIKTLVMEDERSSRRRGHRANSDRASAARPVPPPARKPPVSDARSLAVAETSF